MASGPRWSVAFPYPVQPPKPLSDAFLAWIASIVIGGAHVVPPAPTIEPLLPEPATQTTGSLQGIPEAVQGIVSTIEATAQKYGIDPILALATAVHESGLNNRAIGDGGTSFGLFQLHQGGELGELTPQQAFDPGINAERAISTMAGFGPANRYSSPGAYAAAAQRPADPVAYAAAINSLYHQIAAGTLHLGL